MMVITTCIIVLNRHEIGRKVTKYSTRKNIVKTMISEIKPDGIVLTPYGTWPPRPNSSI